MSDDILEIGVPKPWQFHTGTSDKDGSTETLQVRISPTLGRLMDVSLQEGKERGVPMRTRSDFVRFACSVTLEAFAKFIEVSNESLNHELVLMEQASRTAYQTSLMTSVRTNTTDVVNGLSAMIAPNVQSWQEAKVRLNEFLTNILAMINAGNEFLGNMYLKEIFQNRVLIHILIQLEENLEEGVGPIVTNARKRFESTK